MLCQAGTFSCWYFLHAEGMHAKDIGFLRMGKHPGLDTERLVGLNAQHTYHCIEITYCEAESGDQNLDRVINLSAWPQPVATQRRSQCP